MVTRPSRARDSESLFLAFERGIQRQQTPAIHEYPNNPPLLPVYPRNSSF
jgi:hypothetical protein